MITKIYKQMITAGIIAAIVMISYYLNFPVDLKSIGIYLKTRMHAG